METIIEILGVFSIYSSFLSLLSIAIYVLQSLGLYTLAQRRGIEHAWLAWIPVGSIWILGSIADDYQLKARGLAKNRRKLLIILTAVTVVLALILCGTALGTAFDLIEDSVDLDTRNYSYYEYEEKQEEMEEDVLEMLGSVVLLSLVLMVVSVVAMVFQYICLYDLYASCDPANKGIYLLLSIFVSALPAVFIFVCRNKDDGMRPAPQPGPYGYMPPQQPYQQWQQPQYQPPQYQPPQYQPPQYQQPTQQPPQRQDPGAEQ